MQITLSLSFLSDPSSPRKNSDRKLTLITSDNEKSRNPVTEKEKSEHCIWKTQQNNTIIIFFQGQIYFQCECNLFISIFYLIFIVHRHSSGPMSSSFLQEFTGHDGWCVSTVVLQSWVWMSFSCQNVFSFVTLISSKDTQLISIWTLQLISDSNLVII